MKKTTLKIVLLSVILVGSVLALNQYKKNKALSAKPAEVLPKEFEIQGKSEGVYTRYYMADSKFYKHEMNPLARTTPVEITKEQYLAAYEAFKL